MQIIFITGIETEFDKKLASAFSYGNCKVFAMGEKWIEGVTLLPLNLTEAYFTLSKCAGHIDIYIDVNDKRCENDIFNVRKGISDDIMRKTYEENVIKPMTTLEVFLPLLEAGNGKRLCFLTSTEASINETRCTEGYGYNMAKAALHNFLQITKNVLMPRGYTFRVFDPMYSQAPPEMAAQAAFNYFVRRRGIERGDKRRDDEDNLVFRDAFGRQHTW